MEIIEILRDSSILKDLSFWGFVIVELLSIVILSKACRLMKSVGCLYALLLLFGVIMFFVALFAFLLNGVNVSIIVCAMIVAFLVAHVLCDYGMTKKHSKLLKLTLILDSITVLACNLSILRKDFGISITYLYIICGIEILLIILNATTIRFLSKMTQYRFISIHNHIYHVYNELDIQFGKDKECYRTIYIPVIGDVKLEDNSFITNGSNDDTKYTIQIAYDEEYEIRKDKKIRVEKSEIEGVFFIILTANQTKIAVRDEALMKNILT